MSSQLPTSGDTGEPPAIAVSQTPLALTRTSNATTTIDAHSAAMFALQDRLRAIKPAWQAILWNAHVGDIIEMNWDPATPNQAIVSISPSAEFRLFTSALEFKNTTASSFMFCTLLTIPHPVYWNSKTILFFSPLMSAADIKACLERFSVDDLRHIRRIAMNEDMMFRRARDTVVLRDLEPLLELEEVVLVSELLVAEEPHLGPLLGEKVEFIGLQDNDEKMYGPARLIMQAQERFEEHRLKNPAAWKVPIKVDVVLLERNGLLMPGDYKDPRALDVLTKKKLEEEAAQVRQKEEEEWKKEGKELEEFIMAGSDDETPFWEEENDGSEEENDGDEKNDAELLPVEKSDETDVETVLSGLEMIVLE